MATVPRESERSAEAKASVLEGMAQDIKDDGRRLASDTKNALSSVAEQRKKAAADYMQSMAAAIDRGAQELDRQGRSGSASLVRQASDEIGHLARHVLEREPRQLMQEVEDMVRRRPALFFGAAALAGFGLMRFLKSSGERAAHRTAEPRGSEDRV